MQRYSFISIASAFLIVMPAHAQGADRKIVPTIPESQIQPAELSSPYQFLSAATSINEFVIEAAALAAAKADTTEIKSVAAELASVHEALREGAIAAGKTDGVEIAKPSVDGEQQGLLGKLQAIDGPEFDRTFIEAQVFVHQRAIAIFRGYVSQDSLGKFAAAGIPQLISDYARFAKLAEASAGTAAEPQTPAVQN